MHYEDILLNDEIKFREDKGMAEQEGYYLLYLCDFEKGSRGLLKANGLPDNKSFCIGKFIEGNMYDFITNTKLDYVDDVDVIYDKGEEFYYFEKPCYINCKKIGMGMVSEFLSGFEVNPIVSINAYKDTLNEQFRHAVSGYNQMKDVINKHHNSKVKIR